MQGSGGSFAETGHAMRLMEGVAVALQHQEPVLLVGETGTGKTTLVQRLADQVTCTYCFGSVLPCYGSQLHFSRQNVASLGGNVR